MRILNGPEAGCETYVRTSFTITITGPPDDDDPPDDKTKGGEKKADIKATAIGRAPWLPTILYPLTGVLEFRISNVGTRNALAVSVSGAVGGGKLLAVEGARCTVVGNGFKCKMGKFVPKAKVKIGLAVKPSKAGDRVLSASVVAKTQTPEVTEKNNKARYVEPVIANVAQQITNGCGPSGSSPRLRSFFNAMGVRKACDYHDECWGGRIDGLLQPENRWKSRRYCDEGFRFDSIQGCSTLSRTLRGGTPACLVAISTFFKAIRVGGQGVFMNARRSACKQLYPSNASKRKACVARSEAQSA